MTNENRKEARARLPLEMRWQSISGRQDARVYDISASGCYVESIGQVMPGERIEFEVQLPTGRWIRLQGDVVHFQPQMGFALKFADLSELQRDMLARLVDYALDNPDANSF